MAIKEIPTNFRVYYKSMQNRVTQDKENALKVLLKIEQENNVLYNDIKSNLQLYKDSFNCDLMSYEEFVEDKYIDGKFIKIAKGLFLNKKNNYELVSDLYDLYKYAITQKQIYNITNKIKTYDKMLSLKLNQYNDILKKFYIEVHKKLILEGAGYVLENNIGWICFNRIKLYGNKKLLDFRATNKNKAALKEQGVRLYNKEEAEWCKRNNIEYKAADGRVYKNNEYCYEFLLLGGKLPGSSNWKLTPSDYRARELRGKSNEDLVKLCNNDIEKICELPLDVRSKLNICVEVDKMLYTNFIRNENQKSLNFGKISRKNR